MRVLVASTGGAGHFNPLVPFVEAITRRGDEVLVVVPPSIEAVVREASYAYRLGSEPPADEVAAIRRQLPSVPSLEAAVLGDRELFGRLCTAAMLPAMESAFADWRPDFVLREPCDYASAVMAHRSGTPHAIVAISQARVEMGALGLAAPEVTKHCEGVVDAIKASPFVSRFPASLDPSSFPITYRYKEAPTTGSVSAAGPTDADSGAAAASAARKGAELPDWWTGSAAPLVYVTFGSVVGGLDIAPAVYRAAVEAVAGVDARVLVTVGRGFDRGELGELPANVHVESWVPQDDVLRSAELVVCHGGSGTVFGTLAAGLPMIVVPLFADQRANAKLVADAGAGVVIRSSPALEPAALRAAIEAVRRDRRYREAAGRIAAEMGEAPDVDTVLEALTSALGL